jgi:hypothetical protein
MASKRFDPLTTQGLQRVVVGGSFQPNGTGVPVIAGGHGWTVSRVGAGQYRIQFTDIYFGIEQNIATVRQANGEQAFAQFGAFDPVNNTIDIFVNGGQSGGLTSQTVSQPIQLTAARKLSGGNFDTSAANGGLLASDSIGATLFTSGGVATKIIHQPGSTAEFLWTILNPADATFLDAMGFSIIAKKDGSADTITLNCGVYFNEDPTNYGSVIGPVVAGSYNRYDVLFSGPAVQSSSITLTVTPSVHFSDFLDINGVQLIYNTTYPSPLVPVDFLLDPNTLVSFQCTFKNTGVSY